MRYEVSTGWRYLHAGNRDRLVRWLALASAGVCIAGGVLIAIPATSSCGVVVLELAMIATALFGLLSVFSVFTSVSVLGVALGVAALVVVLAVTTGFEHEFRDKVLGVNAHVIVRKAGGMTDYRDVMKQASALPGVVAVQPFLFHEVLVTVGRGQSAGVAIKGVDPLLANRVLDLDRYVIEGSLASLAAPAVPGVLPPMLIGNALAAKLGAKLGDSLTVVMPFSSIDGRVIGSEPRLRKFRITGIFYCGFDEYDRRLVYTSLAETQALLGAGDLALGVELKVADVDHADDLAAALGAKLGPAFDVIDWYELNHNLFVALALQKLALVIILTLIILVAAVNMVSALTMMVTDKTREIAILKSMGAHTRSIATVFQVVGLAIGVVGTSIGLVIGLTTCHLVGNYGYRLDARVYLIDRLPIEIRPHEVALVAAITLVICFLATVIPARAAATLRPVDGLRYD